MSTVKVDIELGHTSRVRDHIWNKPSYTPQPGEATHEWEFFMRPMHNQSLDFIEKVVVHLHETFPKPKRGQ